MTKYPRLILLLGAGVCAVFENQAYADCGPNASEVRRVREGNNTRVFCKCDQGYVHGSDGCKKPDQELCSAVVARSDTERAAIQQQRNTMAMNSGEIRRWKQLNDHAQWSALKDSVTYFLGELGDKSEGLGNQVTELQEKARVFAERAQNSRKYSKRLEYLSKLGDVTRDWAAARNALLTAQVSGAIADANDAYEVAKNTWHHEFQVTARKNADLRNVLTEPEFKDAFIGDSDDSPGVDVVIDFADKAAEEAVKVGLHFHQADELTGRQVHAAQFVVDAVYDAMESSLSTARVLQDNTVAGELARAAGVLQESNKRIIDELHSCHAAGFGV